MLASEPPKMYSPSAAVDQLPAACSLSLGAVPLGVICCQALPCVDRVTGEGAEDRYNRKARFDVSLQSNKFLSIVQCAQDLNRTLQEVL